MAGKRKKTAGRKRTPKKAVPLLWPRAFLAAFGGTGNVRLACAAAGVSRTAAYDRRGADPAFAAGWDAAKEEAADLLVEEARRRAVEGVEEPVFGSLGGGSGSGEVGTVRRYSDTLLIFLLKGARPETYRENHRHEHSGGVAQTHIYLPRKDDPPV